MSTEPTNTVDRRWLALFEDRYGAAAYERLLAELRQPCITFAAIARQLGVTRERVRQWQRLLLPDAPRGHERKRLCALQRRKRRVMEDPLFRTFFRHARASLNGQRIELILTHDRYRTRSVRIDRQVVVLRAARPLLKAQEGADTPAYLLPPCRSGDFLYCLLTPSVFLLVPARELPTAGTRFVDQRDSRYSPYKNTFSALGAAADELESGLGSA